MKVGEKLKKLRDDRDMSMYRLTQLTGVSGHHIKGIEEGTRQPTIETLNKRNTQQAGECTWLVIGGDIQR
jgi:predicted transcriptional regulator